MADKSADNEEDRKDQGNRHELRKELKLLKLSNMKLKKQLRLAMRVRYLNRIRLEKDVVELNTILEKIRSRILTSANVDFKAHDEKLFKNPKASEFTLKNDLESKYSNKTPKDNKAEREFKFYCDRCEFKCMKKSPFDIHMRRHTGVRPYVCDMCPKSFVARYELTLHQGKHTNKHIYKCNQCSYTTYRPDMLVNHTEKHSGIKSHQCDACDFKTDEKFRLVLHKKSHLPGGTVECKACESSRVNNANKSAVESVTIESNREDNEVEHTCGRRWVCDVCNASFKKRESLTKHTRTHTGERPFRCEWCDYAAAARHTLVIHQRRHSGDKPYVCDQCTFRCTTKGYLKIHMNKHKGIKPFQCKLCSYRSIDSSKLSIHQKVHHSCEKPFACDVCPFRAKLNSRLQHHKRIHAPKPYTCSHCGRTFTTKLAQTEHEGFHTGNQPFKCDVCKTEKRFTLEASFKRHMDRHVLKFNCQDCNYRTSLNKDLQRHMKIHQGNPSKLKSFQCELCKFRCDDVESLQKHTDSHLLETLPTVRLTSENNMVFEPSTDETLKTYAVIDQTNIYASNITFVDNSELQAGQQVFEAIIHPSQITVADGDKQGEQPPNDTIYSVIFTNLQQ